LVDCPLLQSIPVYTTTDQNERDRYLKYTPEHMHCTATFYGPLVAPNTGILAYQIVDNTFAGFRVALTGTSLEQRATPQVVKKLKLTGTPVKVFKNTAFITGMFSTALEVAKFEHAKIKTVSGIRGSIKKAVNQKNDVKGEGNQLLGRLPPGSFRATFEDKILMSDIVICRLWVPVDIKKFYNPILSMLSAQPTNKNSAASVEAQDETAAGQESERSDGQLLMRSTAQLRRELKVAQVVKKDSVYKPIERVPREFSKLKIPSKLQESLPFASKPKMMAAKNPSSYLARRAVILEPEEKKQRGMVQMLSTIKKDKEKKRKQANLERLTHRKKELDREKEKFSDIHREEKKRKYKEMGFEQQRKMRKLN
jgi:ribosome biogenesis protein BMS1